MGEELKVISGAGLKADVTRKRGGDRAGKGMRLPGRGDPAGVGAGYFSLSIDSAVRKVSGRGKLFVPTEENRAVYDHLPSVPILIYITRWCLSSGNTETDGYTS